MIRSKECHISDLINKLLQLYFSRVSSDFIIEIARINKVTYQLGYLFPNFQKNDRWLEIFERRKAQLEELGRFNEVASDLGLRYVIIKTFRFPGYVPDDIDVLIHPNSQHLIRKFVSIFTNKHGYFLRSKGTTEITLRKIVGGTYVDFDVHLDLGAGPYVYLDARTIFENSYLLGLENVNVPVVNKELELIICAAHAVMKEFELTLADLLTFLYLSPSVEMIEILKVAESLGLKNALYIFWRLSQFLIRRIMLGKNTIALPYKIPIPFTIFSYIENLRYRMKVSGTRPMREILIFPSAKGVKKIIGLR
ncbi:MAG: hypothetical protein QXP84_03105 [Candidatus Korarchaeum sp.]